MLNACRTYLSERLQALTLPGAEITPYLADVPEPNIFFEEIPRDFLKDNVYAACCLPLQDRTKRAGKLIAKIRTLAPLPKYTLSRRRYTREVMFRCLLYAANAEDLWGSVLGTGLVEQFQHGVAGVKLIAASDNSAIQVESQDIASPWDSGEEINRKLGRPRLAIARVLFRGGVQTVAEQPIIPGFTINSHVQ